MSDTARMKKLGKDYQRHRKNALANAKRGNIPKMVHNIVLAAQDSERMSEVYAASDYGPDEGHLIPEMAASAAEDLDGYFPWDIKNALEAP
jgi:hypothetical protein